MSSARNLFSGLLVLVLLASIAGCSSFSVNYDYDQNVEWTKFKTYGCGSAIASSSLVTEWMKGKTLDEATEIKNTQIAEELALPPVKIHCSVLAEDAIKAAIADLKQKGSDSDDQAA